MINKPNICLCQCTNPKCSDAGCVSHEPGNCQNISDEFRKLFGEFDDSKNWHHICEHCAERDDDYCTTPHYCGSYVGDLDE